MNEIIQCRDVVKSFKKITALKGVTTQFEKGKITGLVGRNGAGKSTLLNIITNRIPADAGEILVDGQPVFENEKAQSKIYYMSVANFFPSEFNLKKGIELVRRFYPGFSAEEMRDYLKIFELSNAKQKINKLSSGQLSAFKVSLALASNAEYILLDEPVLGLDANNREALYQMLIAKTAQGHSGIVLSTHLIEEVAPLLENIVIINGGSIVLSAAVEDLLKSYYTISGAQDTVKHWTMGQNIIAEKQLGRYTTVGLAGKIPSPSDLPEGLEATPYTLQALVVDLTGAKSISILNEGEK